MLILLPYRSITRDTGQAQQPLPSVRSYAPDDNFKTGYRDNGIQRQIVTFSCRLQRVGLQLKGYIVPGLYKRLDAGKKKGRSAIAPTDTELSSELLKSEWTMLPGCRLHFLQ